MERGVHMDMDAGVDGRWLTYQELAELRRIDKTSALKLAIRRKWPRRKDNHGTMQVCVPLEWAEPRDAGTHGDVDRGMDVSTIVRPLQEAVDALRAQLDRAEAGKEAADRHADRERSRADRAEARADQERSRADAVQAKLEASDAARQQAQQAAEELRLHHASRRSRRLLARLRAAWRGE